MQVDAVHLGGGVQHHPSGRGSGPLGWDKKGGKGTGKGKDGKKGNSEEKVEKEAVKFEVDRRKCGNKEHKRVDCRTMQAEAGARRTAR